MKILELFSGYGTASFALKELGIDYELIGYSDIDKYANQVFKQNHCPNDTEDKLRLGDVKLIDPNKLEDFDLLTGGFPCQAFSVAGKGLGELDPRGTLFYEIIRIAEVKKPRYMLLENVKGLTNKNHRPTFEKILSELARIGYYVKWKILNTKDYGIPQNRERVWFVCFKEESDYYKFKFPEKEELKIFIKDILEPEVDKKYFLSEKLQERFRKYLEDKESKIIAMRSFPRTGTKEEDGERHQNIEPRDDGCSNSLTSVQKDNLVYDRKGFDSRDKFRESELSPTLSTKMGTGGNNVPMIIQKIGDRDKDNISIKTDYANTLNANAMSDRQQIVVQAQISNCSPREVGFKDICPCLAARDYKDPKIVSNAITTAVGRIGHSKEELGYIENNMKAGQLRRLTPKECFRLQGFLNDEVNFNYTEKRYFYKDKGNIKLWKQQSAKSNAVIEQPTHTNMEITALCTTKDLNELELGKNKEEILRKIGNVCIAIERLEKVDAKECVINITKCSDYTEMLYTLIKRKIELNEMDMFVELEEGRGIKSLWKISLEENLSEEKSFIISILINWIIQKKIYSYVKTESTIIANITNYNLLPQNFLNLELLSLRMDTIKKLSDTALYKLAGNGQSLNVVTKIFKEMFK